MIEKLGQNKKATAFIVSAVLVLLLASAVSGCAMDDIVQVDVPKAVAEAVQVDERISYADAVVAWDDWIAYVERESARFSDEIDKGAEIVGILQTLGSTGIAFGQEASAALPGGAMLSTGLALLGGLFLRKPGTDKEISGEKESSFNAGIEKGRQMAEEAISVVRAATGTEDSSEA